MENLLAFIIALAAFGLILYLGFRKTGGGNNNTPASGGGGAIIPPDNKPGTPDQSLQQQ